MPSPLGLCPDSAPAWGCPVTAQAPSLSSHRSTVWRNQQRSGVDSGLGLKGKVAGAGAESAPTV